MVKHSRENPEAPGEPKDCKIFASELQRVLPQILLATLLQGLLILLRLLAFDCSAAAE